MRSIWQAWRQLPVFGIQWLHGFFFTGFGSALLASTGGSGTTSELARFINPNIYGNILIIVGLLFFVAKFGALLYILCLALMPYVIASISFYLESGSLQAISLISSLQAFLLIGIYAENERRKFGVKK